MHIKKNRAQRNQETGNRQEEKMSNYTERPKALHGDTERVRTSCGYIYITVNSLDDKVIEVFASLGKSGGCAKGFLEGLTKSITIGLRSGVELKRYHKILRGIHCNQPTYSEGQQILSCPDAIAMVLNKYLDTEPEQEILPILPKDEDNG